MNPTAVVFSVGWWYSQVHLALARNTVILPKPDSASPACIFGLGEYEALASVARCSSHHAARPYSLRARNRSCLANTENCVRSIGRPRTNTPAVNAVRAASVPMWRQLPM